MSNFQTSKILVAEDDYDLRLKLRLFLEDLDYKVIEARDGAEAVRMAQAKQPNLILMDLNIPVLDGIIAATVIRSSKPLNYVPILTVSADGSRGIDLFMNIKQLGKGYIGYITKPLNLDDLAEQVKTALLSIPQIV